MCKQGSAPIEHWISKHYEGAYFNRQMTDSGHWRLLGLEGRLKAWRIDFRYGGRIWSLEGGLGSWRADLRHERMSRYSPHVQQDISPLGPLRKKMKFNNVIVCRSRTNRLTDPQRVACTWLKRYFHLPIGMYWLTNFLSQTYGTDQHCWSNGWTEKWLSLIDECTVIFRSTMITDHK